MAKTPRFLPALCVNPSFRRNHAELRSKVFQRFNKVAAICLTIHTFSSIMGIKVVIDTVVVLLYNEEIKRQYLATLSGRSVETMRQRFRRVAQDEERLGKDLLEFTKDDLAMVFSSYGFLEVSSVRNLLSTFSAYNQWAKSTGQNFQFSDAVEDFDARIGMIYMPSISQRLVPNPEALVSTATRLYPIDEGYEVLPALIFAWLGFTAGEAVQIKTEQVDCAQRRVFMPDGALYPYPIPECFWEPLRVYAKTRVSERASNSSRRVFADDLGFFLKKMLTQDSKKFGTPFSPENIIVSVTRFSLYYEERFHESVGFSYMTVMQSGRYYRLYQSELSGVDLYAKENKDLVLELGKGKMTGDILTVYEAYRAVFYPR